MYSYYSNSDLFELSIEFFIIMTQNIIVRVRIFSAVTLSIINENTELGHYILIKYMFASS